MSRNEDKKICKGCQTLFVPLRSDQLFCEISCRVRYWDRMMYRRHAEKKKLVKQACKEQFQEQRSQFIETVILELNINEPASHMVLSLNPLEIKIYLLKTKGLTQREIATKLNIKEPFISTTVKQINEKFSYLDSFCQRIFGKNAKELENMLNGNDTFSTKSN